MSDVKMECGKCGQRLEVPEDMHGETVECPSCNEEIVVPAQSPDAPPASDEPVEPELTEAIPDSSDEPKKRGFGKSLLAAAGAADAKVVAVPYSDFKIGSTNRIVHLAAALGMAPPDHVDMDNYVYIYARHRVQDDGKRK